ncbi:cell division protein FtsB [Solemya pervernicosa gill symbiont]|uniref:Cell division protein FtsB n=2 Tax=Gammaproteobacteria incertae sedis TaxID=118884 RepID=A0A1T2L809_9GAMM|nr:cell division protein FtsB [Candidatus Reidiella endopervernicosa]OOZ41200.1 cell division protein FtsB [Solemya pervernicosa gill symbiont]QKQ27074.1 cell division protein FtsB [Candidatus Reidiella endopervernicosa]
MRIVILILLLILLLLQYRLWVGDGSFAEVSRLQKSVAAQAEKNRLLRERNDALEAEVKDLKQGLSAIEERARSDLGMIKKDETYYQVVGD